MTRSPTTATSATTSPTARRRRPSRSWSIPHRGPEAGPPLRRPQATTFPEKNLICIVVGGCIPGPAHVASPMKRPRVHRKGAGAKTCSTPSSRPSCPTASSSSDCILATSALIRTRGYAAFLEWANLRDFVPERASAVRAGRAGAPLPAVQVTRCGHGGRFHAFAEQCDLFRDASSGWVVISTSSRDLHHLLIPSFAWRQPWQRRRDGRSSRPSILELFTRLVVKYNVNVVGGSHFTVETRPAVQHRLPVPPGWMPSSTSCTLRRRSGTGGECRGRADGGVRHRPGVRWRFRSAMTLNSRS